MLIGQVVQKLWKGGGGWVVTLWPLGPGSPKKPRLYRINPSPFYCEIWHIFSCEEQNVLFACYFNQQDFPFNNKPM